MAVLIVDDNPDISLLIVKLLEAEGIAWETARSGEQAVVCCSKRRFSVVIMDQRMPEGMSGIRTAAMLREMELHVPVLLHSAYLSSDIEELAEEFQIDVLAKGDFARLIETVKKHESPT